MADSQAQNRTILRAERIRSARKRVQAREATVHFQLSNQRQVQPSLIEESERIDPAFEALLSLSQVGKFSQCREMKGYWIAQQI